MSADIYDTYDGLRQRASDGPVICPLPELADLYLDDLTIYPSVAAFEADLYDPQHRFTQDVVIDADTHHTDYPRVDCTASPITKALNDALDWADDAHHNRLREQLLTQSALSDHIIDRTPGDDIVALVIVDGFSYDLATPLDYPVQPVVVDGLTATEPGFRRVIYGEGKQSIYSALLNSNGFYNAYGFTYWDRGDEDLSTDLHAAMGHDIHRIRDFSRAVETLQSEGPFDEQTYVQITRMGFDQDSHDRKEEPNRDALLDAIDSDIDMLARALENLANTWRLFVTADHGILWRDEIPDDPPIVCDDWEHHARYVEAVMDLENGYTFTGWDGDQRTALAYPALTRELKHTEWGVHGGFSYQEAIVPLIELTSGDYV